MRRRATSLLQHIDAAGADGWLARLASDRAAAVRVAAAEALSRRTEQLTDAPADSLLNLLRGGRRELVLPLAQGLAVRRERAAFQPLLLVLNVAEADGNDPGTAKARFASACGSAKEVRAGLQLAVAYGYVASSQAAKVDTALDEVCAMSWRLSGR